MFYTTTKNIDKIEKVLDFLSTMEVYGNLLKGTGAMYFERFYPNELPRLNTTLNEAGTELAKLILLSYREEWGKYQEGTLQKQQYNKIISACGFFASLLEYKGNHQLICQMREGIKNGLNLDTIAMNALILGKPSGKPTHFAMINESSISELEKRREKGKSVYGSLIAMIMSLQSKNLDAFPKQKEWLQKIEGETTSKTSAFVFGHV
jgi:hypothetical protein